MVLLIRRKKTVNLPGLVVKVIIQEFEPYMAIRQSKVCIPKFCNKLNPLNGGGTLRETMKVVECAKDATPKNYLNILPVF